MVEMSNTLHKDFIAMQIFLWVSHGWTAVDEINTGREEKTEIQRTYLLSSKNLSTRKQNNYRDDPRKVLKQDLWTDDTKINLYRRDGKCGGWLDQLMVWILFTKHGGGSVMSWAARLLLEQADRS